MVDGGTDFSATWSKKSLVFGCENNICALNIDLLRNLQTPGTLSPPVTAPPASHDREVWSSTAATAPAQEHPSVLVNAAGEDVGCQQF